ncbi:aldehyde dehydrogenase family protein [Candidatus Nitrospira inopinata]|uniref:Lactaldehyde dehydrogenase n=1 Tax=Candidatus Nitrospira inopinata TaxID=1715989 RepID=A0A0S4KLY7_9BACT|nr:aldehyde dehydrogenase family protein [Candidatus Nitrospira inopinata]CUQ65473.1 Lactaldehyde dehydrogenase [Candidatus Nitrospira inopinata]
MQQSRPFLLHGQWKQSDRTTTVIDPFTGRTVATVSQASENDLEEAIASTVEAAPVMAGMPGHARYKILQQIAALLSQRRDEIASTITAEAGKPITDAKREVDRAVQTFTVAAEESRRIAGEVVPLDWTPGSDAHVGILRRFPIGPVLGITPFNFPLNLVAHKVAPALAAGNPILIKPAPQTPLTALLLGEIALQAGLPPGGLNVVPCDNLLAERLVVDPRFKLLSFTGSAAVGWMLKAKCGKKKVVLELGGNAGVIVEPDADLDLAARRCAAGGFGYAGQTCISVQRVFVHQAVADPFTTKLLMHVARLKAGDPTDDTTTIGPLIDHAAAHRVESWINEAVAEGARVLLGGKRMGSVIEATVLSDVKPDMKVSCQEVFGPVVTVTPYSRFGEAIAMLNQSDYGLQAGVFTRDINKVFYAFRHLEVGAVLANEIPTFRSDHMPYGGVKDSGLGREGVRAAIEEMTEPKLLIVNAQAPDPSA